MASEETQFDGDPPTVVKSTNGRPAPKPGQPNGKISDVFGFLKQKDGPVLSIEEINEAAARGWAGER